MAKILGQLERAQYENIVGSPSTALAVGRFWVDTTVPTAGVPKFYNGSAIFSMGLYGSSTNASSGAGAITINWGLGTVQILTLTGNAVITHQNMPTTGQPCNLIILQAASIPLFQVLFTSDNYWQKEIVPQLLPQNGARKFVFLSVAAFLPAITTLGAFVSPGIVAVTAMGQAALSYDGNWIAFSNATTALRCMSLNQGALGLNFGAPLTAVTAAGTISVIAWHPSGSYVAVGIGTTPFISVYPVSAGQLLSPVTTPASVPAAAVTGLAWSPSGDAICYATGTTPFLGGYPFTNGNFGTAYTAPGILPTAGHGVAFHPSGLLVAVGQDAAPGVAAYPFTSSAGFGTKSSGPSVVTFLATQNSTSICFSPDGNYLALAVTATPFVNIWPITSAGVFGTLVANPSTLPASQTFGVAFSALNDYFYCTTRTGSTVLYAYPWTGVFGTLGSNPTTLPPVTTLQGILAHPTSEFVGFFGSTTPFCGFYEAPRTVKNYLSSQY